MPPQYLPLRWESTRDQWWYVSPIDWAAANGYYNLVRELLHLDTNLLIKLTSLRRIRRLETVWDDEKQFEDVPKFRSQVAQKLLHACEKKGGHQNSLIRAGYGGWLLYTAASAGDVTFVNELLEIDPLLVFGEGEYGVTDILYAASRSKNCEVFRLLFDFCVSPRCFHCYNGETDNQSGEILATYKWEMMNRAVHAAARGGNLEILKELIGVCSDVLGYRDVQGSTILHTAAGRGQVEVVKYLLASYDLTDSRDNQGNTALHVAAYRGHLAVLEAIILASPSSTSVANNNGDTFLHMAVSGFQTPGFRRLDRQIELMEQLICGTFVNMKEIINVRNNDGRTALHLAVIENIQFELVELLMNVSSINLNIRDVDGFTPLGLLKKRPKSVSSDILIKQLISAGGVSNAQYRLTRTALVSRMKMEGTGTSPGSSFRISDAEIFLYTGIDNASDPSLAPVSANFSEEISETDLFETDSAYNSWNNNKLSSVSNAARRLKILLRWARKKERKPDSAKTRDDVHDDDNESIESYNMFRNLKRQSTPIPLRQRCSEQSSNIKTLGTSNSLPSSFIKRKFAAGLMQGVIQPIQLVTTLNGSPTSSTFSKSSSVVSSPTSISKGSPQVNKKMSSLNKQLMNRYLCFGAQGIAVDGSIRPAKINQSHKHPGFLMA